MDGTGINVREGEERRGNGNSCVSNDLVVCVIIAGACMFVGVCLVLFDSMLHSLG